MNSEERKGDLLILGEAFIWGFFPIVTVLTYAKLPGLVSLGWSTIFAMLFFGVLIVYRGTWRELLNPLLWKYTLMVALFIGVLFYSFYFFGLTRTTTGNAGIIALFEICTSFLFFHVIRKDHISFEHIIGGICMVAGAIVILLPNFREFNAGDIFVLAATFCAPIGNLFQQKARKIASAETTLFLRALFSIPAIFILASFLNFHAPLADVRASLLFLLINGVVLFGLTKIMWLEAIHRISVTKAMSLSSISALFTLLFGWLLLHQMPTSSQLISLVPMFLGVLLLTNQLKLKNPHRLEPREYN